MLFMTLTSNLEIAIAAQTIIWFPLINKKGKKAQGKGIHKIHARQHRKNGAASAQKSMQIAEHTIQASASAKQRSHLHPTYISLVAVSAMGQKERKNLMNLQDSSLPWCVILRPLQMDSMGKKTPLKVISLSCLV